MEFQGNEVMPLWSATSQDKKTEYHWLAHSNLTREMLGPQFPRKFLFRPGMDLTRIIGSTISIVRNHIRKDVLL